MNSQNAQFFIAVTFLFALSVALYAMLRKRQPGAARMALSVGGAIAGSFLGLVLVTTVFSHFRDGWNLFGLFILSVPIGVVVGGIAGFLAALRWTETTSQDVETRRPANTRAADVARFLGLVSAPFVVLILLLSLFLK